MCMHMYTYIHTYVHTYVCSKMLNRKCVCVSICKKQHLNQKHPGCKKRSGKELKKGLDKKDVKSKWAAKACVVLLLMEIKF